MFSPSSHNGRIVVHRYTPPDGAETVQVEECFGGNGLPLALPEALGLLRMAQDELLSSHLRLALETVRRMVLADATDDEWDAERDATIVTYITEILSGVDVMDGRPKSA